MYKARIAAIVALVALTVLPGRSLAVTNAVVGTCKAGTQFPAIQAAVNAATLASTVLVCPGNYPEQVTILKNLTLQGISPSFIGAATIVPPAAGLKVNATSGIWGGLAAQLLVQQATRVTVNNIEVDGGGQTTCTGSVVRVGILFQGPADSLPTVRFATLRPAGPELPSSQMQYQRRSSLPRIASAIAGLPVLRLISIAILWPQAI